MLVQAQHNPTFDVIAGQVVVVGGQGVGASVSALTKTDLTNAYIASSDQISANGVHGPTAVLAGTTDGNGNLITNILGVAVLATDVENLSTIAVGGSLGSSTGVGGSAAVNVDNQTTTVHIDLGLSIAATGTIGFGPGVLVLAANPTNWFATAGALAGGGGLGLGIGADVGVVTKDTEASISSPTINVPATVAVIAQSNENITSLTAAVGVAGTAGIAGSAGIYVIGVTTKAYIASSQSAPALVNAGGSVDVAAEEALGFHLITGNFTGSGAASVGAAAGVPIVTKTTQSYIGPFATINALGQGPTYRTSSSAPARTRSPSTSTARICRQRRASTAAGTPPARSPRISSTT